MQIKIFFMYVLILTIITCNAEIRTIKSYNDIIAVLSEANEKTLVLFDIDQTIITAGCQIIENNIVNIIKDLQSRQVNVFAFTARDSAHCIMKGSYEHLRGLSLDFDNGRFKNFDILEINHANPPRFYNGIIFTNGHYNGFTKGKVLNSFLEGIKMRPTKIIFFDDLLINLEHVQTSIKEFNDMQKKSIEFYGYHYQHPNR